jgi:hypothetical protein
MKWQESLYTYFDKPDKALSAYVAQSTNAEQLRTKSIHVPAYPYIDATDVKTSPDDRRIQYAMQCLT